METILYLDCPGYNPLPPGDSLRVIGRNYNIQSVTDVSSARRILINLTEIAVFVTNTPNYEVLSLFRQNHTNGSSILVTSLPMHLYSAALKNKEENLLDHVVAYSGSEPLNINDLRITIAKLQSKDIFGIEKYLSPNTVIFRETIQSSLQREELNTQVMEFARSCNFGQHTSRIIFGITEEMLMNTILDAPLAAGIPRFKELDLTEVIELRPEEQGELSFGCDGRTFAISTSDPFGALRRETLFFYLKKVLKQRTNEHIIDNKKGGAGLGLFRILYSSSSLICNVEYGKKTEIISLLEMNSQQRDLSKRARSIHYFLK